MATSNAPLPPRFGSTHPFPLRLCTLCYAGGKALLLSPCGLTQLGGSRALLFPRYVRDVEVLDRHIDEEGRLHSTRLLTMKGSLPAFIQPFVPVRQMHMLETVVVDPATQQMSVTTCNINCTSVMHALSESTYTPAPAQPDQTRYQISIFVKAFPKRRPADTDRTGPLSAAEIAAQVIAAPTGSSTPRQHCQLAFCPATVRRVPCLRSRPRRRTRGGRKPYTPKP